MERRGFIATLAALIGIGTIKATEPKRDHESLEQYKKELSGLRPLEKLARDLKQAEAETAATKAELEQAYAEYENVKALNVKVQAWASQPRFQEVCDSRNPAIWTAQDWEEYRAYNRALKRIDELLIADCRRPDRLQRSY